jgi:hypothetical protein
MAISHNQPSSPTEKGSFSWMKSSLCSRRRVGYQKKNTTELKDESKGDTSARFAFPLIMSYNVDKEK